MASCKRWNEKMNDYEDIAESYKEALDISEKIVQTQNEVIANLQHQESLWKQRIRCQDKIIKVLKEQLKCDDVSIQELNRQ